MPGGNYSMFPGRDASVALSRMNFEEKNFDPKINWKKDLNQ